MYKCSHCHVLSTESRDWDYRCRIAYMNESGNLAVCHGILERFDLQFTAEVKVKNKDDE
jgi:hypothetical protein